MNRACPKPNGIIGKIAAHPPSMPSYVTSLIIKRYKCVKNTKLIEQRIKISKYDYPKYEVKPPKNGTEMLAMA